MSSSELLQPPSFFRLRLLILSRSLALLLLIIGVALSAGYFDPLCALDYGEVFEPIEAAAFVH